MNNISIAQATSKLTNQLWFDYYLYYLPKDALQILGDASYRRNLTASDWNQFLIRGSAFHSSKSWLGLYAGMGIFFTTQKEITNTLEIRPWIGGKLIFNIDFLSSVRITNFSRIEMRYVINTQASGTSNDIRFRNRTDMRIPITNYSLKDNTLYLMFEIEFFTNSIKILEQSADKIRLGAGIGYKINYSWRVEFLYNANRLKNTAQGRDTKTANIWRFHTRHYLQ
jgi:hypothetical protein